MSGKVQRLTVDLSAFPDLVVIYLGMRVNVLTGLKTLFGLGPQIKNSVDQKPDGLLLHENFIMSLISLHLGMRQYWRDFDALEAWSRSTPHREWWRNFLQSSGGTGFCMRHISCGVAWKQFTTTCPCVWALDNSHLSSLREDRCSLRDTGLSWPVTHLPQSSKRRNFMVSMPGRLASRR